LRRAKRAGANRQNSWLAINQGISKSKRFSGAGKCEPESRFLFLAASAVGGRGESNRKQFES